MPTYTLKFKEKRNIAEGTKMFIFERPAEFEYRAGQYLDWTLENSAETDSEGNTRSFSIASSPTEDYLAFATRMRDTAFKREIDKMSPGSTLKAVGPMGSFTLLNDSSKPIVFLTGGIGITPIRSMIFNATYKKLPHKLFLFYSNRRPEDAAFLEEITKLQGANPNLKVIGTMTQMDKSQKPWIGERGYITGKMVQKYIGDLENAIYYISGPETMVSAMHKTLISININEDFIKTEEFPGY